MGSNLLECVSLCGGRPLEGAVRVSGAKNSALPLLFATLLTEDECELLNVPDLEDIGVTLRLLESLGAVSSFRQGKVKVRTPQLDSTEAPYGLVKALRASFWVLGPLLARAREAQVALPGGDAIGSRPVDLHIDALSSMGADIGMQHGVVFAQAPGGLRGARIGLRFPSVGATHNVLMAAARTPGETVIEGAAREPEVVQLCQFLTLMGAEIEGLGTARLRVKGQDRLRGASIEVLADRVEAATYLCAGAMNKGPVCVQGIAPESVRSLLHVLESAGARVETEHGAICVSSPQTLQAVSCSTAPYPGLATDVQPLLMAVLTQAHGTSVLTETVFENRFGHVAEYRRLGADIQIDGRVASIRGPVTLSAAPVDARDIRAAAGLVLLGLVAEGTTEIHQVHHLDRGYESLIEKFSALGADISRVPVFESKELVFGC